MHPRLATVLALVLLDGCSCEPSTKLSDIAVERATLSDLSFIGVGVLGSVREGTGKLHVEATSGETHDVDVTLPMTISGGLMEMTMSTINGAEGEYDLAQLASPKGSDLLGPFDGIALSAGMLGGGSLLNLESETHVEVTVAGGELVLGMTLLAGQVWTSIDVAPEDECDDGVDDDLDGAFDCDDPDCEREQACALVPPPPPPPPPIDAGPGSDGGESVSDAGESDAGEGESDAGESVSDAGVIDGGEG